jgi:hypothetical protein
MNGLLEKETIDALEFIRPKIHGSADSLQSLTITACDCTGQCWQSCGDECTGGIYGERENDT